VPCSTACDTATDGTDRVGLSGGDDFTEQPRLVRAKELNGEVIISSHTCTYFTFPLPLSEKFLTCRIKLAHNAG